MKRALGVVIAAGTLVLGVLISGHAGYGRTPSNMPTPFQERFSNVAGSAGIGSLQTDGAAWGDFDNDGWEDLLYAGPKLFRNKGNGQFEDVTSKTGLDKGVGGRVGYWADYDNDGDLDIYFVPGILVRNDNGKFKNVSKEAGIPNIQEAHKYTLSESASWGDFNNDGFVDIIICAPWGEAAFKPGAMHLYKNNGNGTFSDVTGNVGLPAGKAGRQPRVPVWCDYDNDGDQDLYVSCYGMTPDYLFRNDGGKFKEVSGAAGILQGSKEANGHCLGAMWCDFNRDGHFDIYVVPQHDATRLYQNQGNGTFRNVSAQVGANDGQPKFRGSGNEHLGTSSADYNNDGWPDIYNTHEAEGSKSNQLLRNKGNGTFESATNILEAYTGGAAAWGDFNNDGFPDLAVGMEGSSAQGTKNIPIKLFKNETRNGNHWIQVKLVGKKKTNGAAIGARATVTAGGLTQIQEVQSGHGMMSQNSLILTFGLGKADKVDKLTVRWTDGTTQDVTVETVDKRIVVEEGGSSGPIK